MSVLPPVIIVQMHPSIWRGRAHLCQLDHMNGRRVSALLARPAFQRGLKFPDRRIARPPDGVERDARLGHKTGISGLKKRLRRPLLKRQSRFCRRGN